MPLCPGCKQTELGLDTSDTFDVLEARASSSAIAASSAPIAAPFGTTGTSFFDWLPDELLELILCSFENLAVTYSENRCRAAHERRKALLTVGSIPRVCRRWNRIAGGFDALCVRMAGAGFYLQETSTTVPNDKICDGVTYAMSFSLILEPEIRPSCHNIFAYFGAEVPETVERGPVFFVNMSGPLPCYGVHWQAPRKGSTYSNKMTILLSVAYLFNGKPRLYAYDPRKGTRARVRSEYGPGRSAVYNAGRAHHAKRLEALFPFVSAFADAAVHAWLESPRGFYRGIARNLLVRNKSFDATGLLT